MIITLLAEGHALVEGAPGLAKTKAVKTLADGISASFNRFSLRPTCCRRILPEARFTSVRKASSNFAKGPIFANLVLADEINRAPAKVQSALLEAMAERQVSVGGQRFFAAAFVYGDGNPEPD